MPPFAELLSSTGGTLLLVFLAILPLSVGYLVKRGRSREIPSVSISLGITFTFIGIFIALWGFDVRDIQNSIPQLLAGMRLAFGSSIVGISVAVFYRIAPDLSIWSTDSSKEGSEGVTTIRQLNNAQSRRHKEQAERLDEIETALAGEGDTTLLTQLQKLRTSFTDKQDELVEAFDQFTEQIAEDQTEALIEALEGVIRDFNTKINEQFGENFKELNQAVGQLVDWQEEYRQQVETMTERLDVATKSLEESEKALQQVSEHAKSFDESADRLDDVVVAFKNEIDALEQHLESFAKLGEEAGDALPTIKENFREVTDIYREAVESMRGEIERSAEGQREAISEVMTEMQDEQRRLQETLQETSEQTAENIAQRIEELDEELGDELNKALSSLGSQLTSLSEKFVEDYEPLTKQLQEVVKLSEEIRQKNGR
jgi:chromosome segregation ATPase